MRVSARLHMPTYDIQFRDLFMAPRAMAATSKLSPARQNIYLHLLTSRDGRVTADRDGWTLGTGGGHRLTVGQHGEVGKKTTTAVSHMGIGYVCRLFA